VINSIPEGHLIDSNEMDDFLKGFFFPFQAYDNMSYVKDCDLKIIFDTVTEKLKKQITLINYLEKAVHSQVLSPKDPTRINHINSREKFISVTN
jgi:hypothetical protein